MGYYVTPSPDYIYYEGDKRAAVDIAVTQRPHPVAIWNGAAWEYEISSCQAYQRAKVNKDMTADFEDVLAAFEISDYVAIFVALLFSDATAFEDNTGRTAASVAALEAYRVEAGLATLALAANAVQANWDTTIFGTALARRDGLFALINAETVGFDVLSYNWTPL